MGSYLESMSVENSRENTKNNGVQEEHLVKHFTQIEIRKVIVKILEHKEFWCGNNNGEHVLVLQTEQHCKKKSNLNFLWYIYFSGKWLPTVSIWSFTDPVIVAQIYSSPTNTCNDCRPQTKPQGIKKEKEKKKDQR